MKTFMLDFKNMRPAQKQIWDQFRKNMNFLYMGTVVGTAVLFVVCLLLCITFFSLIPLVFVALFILAMYGAARDVERGRDNKLYAEQQAHDYWLWQWEQYRIAYAQYREQYAMWEAHNAVIQQIKETDELTDSVLEWSQLEGDVTDDDCTAIAVMGYIRDPDLKAIIRIADSTGLSDKAWKRSVRSRTSRDELTGDIRSYNYIMLNGKEYKVKGQYYGQ